MKKTSYTYMFKVLISLLKQSSTFLCVGLLPQYLIALECCGLATSVQRKHEEKPYVLISEKDHHDRLLSICGISVW